MAVNKNLNGIDEPRAHRFLSAFGHHVGEEKFEDDGRKSAFHKRSRLLDATFYGPSYGSASIESDLMREAQKRKEGKTKDKAKKPTKKHWWET